MGDWCDTCTKRSEHRVFVDTGITSYFCSRCYQLHLNKAKDARAALACPPRDPYRLHSTADLTPPTPADTQPTGMTVAEALRELGLTVDRAERDAMLLDGRDFDQARFDEARRLLALLCARDSCPCASLSAAVPESSEHGA